jgi:hypothetical protein
MCAGCNGQPAFDEWSQRMLARMNHAIYPQITPISADSFSVTRPALVEISGNLRNLWMREDSPKS